MNRIWVSIKKEFLILVRDWAGLGLIFLMPVVLVLVMTLIQDATFRKLDESKITLLYLDEDHDSLGLKVKQGLENSGYFVLVTRVNDREMDEKVLVNKVADGKFQMGVVVRPGSTDAIRARGQKIIEKMLADADSPTVTDSTKRARIMIYFDPAIKMSMKVTVRNALENFTSKIEAGILFQSLNKELADYLPEPPGVVPDPGSGITYEEVYAANEYTDIIPNSVQHNVPAWTIFAMFFIIIPLTGNLVREKQSGLGTRLSVMPGNQFQALSAKIAVYTVVGLIQFLLILILAKLVFPLLDLPALVLGPEKVALVLLTITTTLAATGYSVMVGTIARTHDQAAVFGMVSVIILAAIGGIWVPVFMMNKAMQSFSVVSPLNWSLNGFYDILLRGGGLIDVARNLALLLTFFVITLGVAVWVSEKKKRM